MSIFFSEDIERDVVVVKFRVASRLFLFYLVRLACVCGGSGSVIGGGVVMFSVTGENLIDAVQNPVYGAALFCGGGGGGPFAGGARMLR